MLKKPSLKKGFSLVELLIVIALLGIITGIAVVKFTGYKKKGKVVEAKVMLSNLFGNERIYYVETDNYHQNLETIGLELIGSHIYNVGFGKKLTGGNCTNVFGTSKPEDCGSAKVNTYQVCGENFNSNNLECMWDSSEVTSSSKKTAIKQLAATKSGCGQGLSPQWGDGGSVDSQIIYDVVRQRFTKFRAFACADLGGSDLDVWSIDYRKNLMQRKDGTK